MTTKRVCIINVVGLTQALLPHAPNAAACGKAENWQGTWPAVTSTAQATMLTGKLPQEHGIVGNGWYFRDTAEIRFWQQANSLVQAEKFYEGYKTAKMFWWYNQNAPVQFSVTPKPYYGCDGSKQFGILDNSGCDLESKLGKFPFHTFWGPTAGLPCSDWIARASAEVMRRQQPQITLVYLPHLDYDFQRFDIHDPQRVVEVDDCVAMVVEAAKEIDATPIIVSEYGLTPVKQAVCLNRVLRQQGFLKVRNGPYGDVLLPGESKAFAVCDHQIAHIYINDPRVTKAVAACLTEQSGVHKVVSPESLDLNHPRSGELIAIAKPDAWFSYYYWVDDANAPDFARTVDIHRKPGYDPCELFMTSKLRAGGRLLQKKLGMRYKLDVIPLDNSLIKGSHGLDVQGEHGPIIIGPNPPASMVEFFDYVRGLL